MKATGKVLSRHAGSPTARLSGGCPNERPAVRRRGKRVLGPLFLGGSETRSTPPEIPTPDGVSWRTWLSKFFFEKNRTFGFVSTWLSCHVVACKTCSSEGFGPGFAIGPPLQNASERPVRRANPPGVAALGNQPQTPLAVACGMCIFIQCFARSLSTDARGNASPLRNWVCPFVGGLSWTC